VLDISPHVHVFIVAAAVLLAGLAQLAIQVPPLARHGIRLRPAWDMSTEPFRRVLRLMGPMVLGLSATQISTLVNDFTALWLSGSAEKGQTFALFGHAIRYPLWEGAVSHLFYAQRLYQLPLGVFGISLATAIFPEMSIDAAQQDFDALRRTISRGIRCTVFVALPATAGLLLVSRSVVAVIFERGEFLPTDTAKTAIALSFYVLGLTGYFAQQVLTRAFYSLQESGIPARTTVVAVGVGLVLNLVLVWPLGGGGLAAATAISSYIQVAMLVIALRRRLGPGALAGLGRAVRDTALAALCMTAAVGGIQHFLGSSGDVLTLLAAVTVGVVVYVVSARLLHIEMLALLVRTGSKRSK